MTEIPKPVCSCCKDLLKQNKAAWEKAAGCTSCGFFKNIITNLITAGQMNTWIVQHRRHLLGMIRLVGGCIAKAPEYHTELLLECLFQLEQELRKFKATLDSKRINSGSLKSVPDTQLFMEFVEDCLNEPYAVMATMLWTISHLQHERWKCILAVPSLSQTYLDYAHQWGTDDFGSHCTALEAQADQGLAKLRGAQKIIQLQTTSEMFQDLLVLQLESDQHIVLKAGKVLKDDLYKLITLF